MKDHYQVLIVGGGAAGLTVGAHLRNLPEPLEVAIIEPSTKHYYQPIWTLVGAGVFPKEISEREEEDFMPEGTTWIRDYVDSFDPNNNAVTLRSGKAVSYDYLVVAAGLQINWDVIPGLADSVSKPGSGVCSNYSYETVESTWATLQKTTGGTAIFTHPNTPIKCGGVPQKIMYLSEDYWRKNGRRDDMRVVFVKPGGAIFGVDKYTRQLEKIVEKREIETLFGHHLTAIHPDRKEADFENLANGETVTMKYDMLHVTPPMSAPDFIKNSSLGNEGGWVDLDKHTLQHVRYPNVFGVGDCTSLPTAKTGAGVRKQAPVLVANMLAQMNGDSIPQKEYNGYTSCPLVTGYGKLIMAEFDYDSQPVETFPFDQSKERYSMYALKAYGLPEMYWHGMLRGRV